jgi:hypothetical protein
MPLICASYLVFGAFLVTSFTNPAVAEPPAPDLSGRWQAAGKPLMIDIARCGADWCGIEVLASGACGREVLRLVQANAVPLWLLGRLELGPGVQSYAVEARLEAADQERRPKLVIVGGPGRSFQPMRRMLPFSATFAHMGAAQCGAPRPVS